MSDTEQSSEGEISPERYPTMASDIDTMVGKSAKETPRDEAESEQNNDARFTTEDNVSSAASSRQGRESQTSRLGSKEDNRDNGEDRTGLNQDSLDQEQNRPFADSQEGSTQQSEAESPLPASTSKLRILQELAQMQAADDAKKMQEKYNRQVEKEKILKQMEEERKRRGVTILPNVHQSRNSIEYHLKREIRSASNKERELLKEETERINLEIEAKHGLSKKKDTDFTALAANFYEGKKLATETLPDHIRRSMTSEEIADLRLVFDMFDLKEKGYITVTDLRRAAGMLGFKAKKKVFVDMIAELAKDSKGQVTFINFLDFIVRSQGEGPDPFDEILQGFRLLDTSKKGYLTFEDIREASDRLSLSLSNRAIREMMQEADKTGNGKVGQEDFIRLMMQTNTFKTNLAR
ncbi:uncharacterized protein LOC121372088 [Gigantopelta aegis]|uniref:uncharacterized protein LOC121372088 n=1 Tax=Gigantopelta aegis TaxID=1735272 RepID=UPI001B88D32D|nr:uncharacterized protein LOC121372088 [Gigantopelta aegis]